MSKKLLMTGEVARLARVSEVTVRNWTQNGRLACTRTSSGVRLYDPVDVSVFLIGRTLGSNKCAAGVHAYSAGAAGGNCECGLSKWPGDDVVPSNEDTIQ